MQAAGAVAFDITDGDAVRKAFAKLESDLGPLEILVNNAGMTIRKPALDVTDDGWQHVVDTDLTACFRTSREALWLMLPRSRGRHHGLIDHGAPGTPDDPRLHRREEWLRGLVRALAVEFALSGVTVNAIAPGFFPSDANLGMRQDPVFAAWVNERIPMSRWGDPAAELGPATVFLADAASYITGRFLPSMADSPQRCNNAYAAQANGA